MHCIYYSLSSSLLISSMSTRLPVRELKSPVSIILLCLLVLEMFINVVSRFSKQLISLYLEPSGGL